MHETYDTAGRRAFLKRMGGAAAGMLAAPLAGCGTKPAALPFVRRPVADPGDARVHLVTGNERRQLMRDALEPYTEEIGRAVQGKRVLVKVNFVGTGQPLAVTHPDAVRGLLDFLTPLHDGTIVIGESKGFKPSFEEYGYLPLAREYNVQLAELQEGRLSTRWILDEQLRPQTIRVVDIYFDPDIYLISLTRLKSHNAVVATLTLKNVIMGLPLKWPDRNINDKAKMHTTGRTPKLLHYNLFHLANEVRPDLCVLDGFEGMEGNGPADGTSVDHRVALAGTDVVAVDRIGTELMGVPFENVGYLGFCAQAGLGQGDRSRIRITGENPADHLRTYKLHDNIGWQLRWLDEIDWDAAEGRKS